MILWIHELTHSIDRILDLVFVTLRKRQRKLVAIYKLQFSEKLSIINDLSTHLQNVKIFIYI